MTLTASRVSVRFGGLQALQNVSLEIHPGEIVALIGPNGAGKTTFINAISGFVRPQSGELNVDGRLSDLTSRTRSNHRAGIGRTFQTPRVDPDATLEDNLKLGFYPTTRTRLVGSALRLPRMIAEEEAITTATWSLLERLDLISIASKRARDATIADLRMLEVARAMASGASYVLLDEPAAGLDSEARSLLADLLRSIRNEGHGLLLVEHNFSFVRELSDKVVVLHQGELFATGSPQAVATDERVLEIYLGGVDRDE